MSKLIKLNTSLHLFYVCLVCVFISEGLERLFSLNDFGYMVFHSPYCKLVQKSLARLLLNDFLSHPNPDMDSGTFNGLEAFRSVSMNEEMYRDTDWSFPVRPCFYTSIKKNM